MKRFLCICCLAAAICGLKGADTLRVQPLPSLAVSGEQGVSAPFAGMLGSQLCVAGGCNFPHVPAADGGEKVFYANVYTLELGKNHAWKAVGSLPCAAAYGVSLQVPEGLVCAGGTDGKKSLREVGLLRTSHSDALVYTALPPLPVGIDNAAGAVVPIPTCSESTSPRVWRAWLYVLGGQTDGVPSHRVFRLRWPDGTAWQEVAPLPGEPRVQPVAAPAHEGVMVIGGFCPPRGDKLGFVHTRPLYFDGLKGTWKELPAFALPGSHHPFACVGGIAWQAPFRKSMADGNPLGLRGIYLAGGVDAARFEEAINRPILLQQAQKRNDRKTVKRLQRETDEYLRHPVAWYRFPAACIYYEPTSGKASVVGSTARLARAGAGLAVQADTVYVIGGETKPGIRSADCTACSF